MAAGALGFSTSRTLLHRVPDGRPVPGHVGRRTTSCSRSATCSAGTARACTRSRPASSARATTTKGHARRGALDGRDQPPHRSAGDVRCSRRATRAPSCSARSSSSSTRRPRPGGELRPQTTARGIGLLFGHAAPHVLRPRAGMAARCTRSPFADAARRARRRDAPCRAARARPRRTRPRSTGPASTCSPPDARRLLRRPDTSSARTPRRAGETIVEAFVRISRETQRPRAVQLPVPQPAHGRGRGDARPPADGDRPRRLRRARRADHGRRRLPTWFLLHWVRDRGKYTIEDGIRRMTSDTATLFGVDGPRRAARRARSPTST